MPSVPKPARTPSQRGKASKQKGHRLEVEWAQRIDGEVVRLSGALGGDKSNDVKQPQLGEWYYECKGGGQVPSTPYKWLRREVNCGVDTVKHTTDAMPITAGGKGRVKPPQAVAMRGDNSNWLVVIPEDEWRHLLNRLVNAERAALEGDLDRAIAILRQARERGQG